jgi:hypothetical protein
MDVAEKRGARATMVRLVINMRLDLGGAFYFKLDALQMFTKQGGPSMLEQVRDLVFNIIVPLVTYTLLIAADAYLIFVSPRLREKKVIGGILGLITFVLVIYINNNTHFLAPLDVPIPFILLFLLITLGIGIAAGFITLWLVRVLLVEKILVGIIVWFVTAGILVSMYFFLASQNVRPVFSVGAFAFLMGNVLFLLFSGVSWLRGAESEERGRW